HHGFGGRGALFGGLDAAATYLDTTVDKLATELQAGKSLADVAKEKNKSVDGLEQALTDAAKKKLDAAVADKRITQAQADAMLAEVKQHVSELVQAKGLCPGG